MLYLNSGFIWEFGELVFTAYGSLEIIFYSLLSALFMFFLFALSPMTKIIFRPTKIAILLGTIGCA